MSHVDRQMPLALPHAMQVIDIETVRRQPSMTKAIVTCVDLGGFSNEKDFCRTVGIDPATWSRIKSGDAHFPHESFGALFDACDNELPLLWLADRRGYVLTPKETELERQLRLEREARAKVEAERDLLRGLLIGRSVP